jgi:hypothetical protein
MLPAHLRRRPARAPPDLVEAAQGGRAVKFRRRFGLRPKIVGLITVTAAALVIVPIALAGAISSTTNPTVDNGGTGTPVLCLNGGVDANTGGGAVNCNIYTAKQYVWLSGLPDSASLDPGTYVFAVLDPGGQRNPNDGTAGNLSDDTDAYTNRIFTIATDGTLTTAGTHDVAGNRIRVGVSPALVFGGPDWFRDTDNQGGVYILAVCELPNPVTDSPGVDPQVCKYDAFKISTTDTTPPASDLTVTKDATPAFTRTYTWTISKTVNGQHTVSYSQTSTTKNLSYVIALTKGAAVDSGWQVTGQVHVTNANSFAVSGMTVTENNSACKLWDGTAFVAGPLTNQSVGALSTLDINYKCTWTTAQTTGSNTATVTWPISYGTDNTSATSDPAATWDFGNVTPTVVHNSVTLSDVYTTVPSSLPAGVTYTLHTGTGLPGSGPYSSSQNFTYSYDVTIPHGCVTINNTAAFRYSGSTSNDGSDSTSATICHLVSGLTIGYWQNKNGQNRIVANSAGYTCAALYTYLHQFAPFSGLTTSVCGTSAGLTGKNTASTGIAGYVYDVIKAANASGTNMDAMLRAQMLATALNVFFGVTKGTDVIDLIHGCKMIDNSGGTATCSGPEDWSPAFDNQASMTVNDMLTWAAGHFTYGGSKALQGLAKDAFDAINNSVALTV